jgi:hypothetical protein
MSVMLGFVSIGIRPPSELLAQFRSFEAVDASTKENLERNPGVFAQIVRLSSNWDHKTPPRICGESRIRGSW